MSIDYGKAAYLKVEELALRVAALESEKAAPKYDTTDMSFKIYCGSSAVKTINFRAIGRQNASLVINALTFTAVCSATLNGNDIHMSGGHVDDKFELKDGNNELVFNFDNGNTEWINVSISVGGYLEKYEPKRFLANVGENYYSYFDDGTFYLCRAPSQNPIVTLYDVKHASANYTPSSGIFASYIDRSGRLKIQRYYQSGELYLETEAQGNYSECLVRVKRGYVILYVIAGNYVKTGFVSFDGTTSLTHTNIRASHLTFRSVNSVDYLLVTDIDGKVYMCSLSDTDYVTVTGKRSLGKLDRAMISIAGDDVSIWHNKGGAVVERVLRSGEFSPDGKISEGEEALITDGGYIIARTGNILNIH